MDAPVSDRRSHELPAIHTRTEIPHGRRNYPEAPQVQDRVDRGDLTGERTDRVTWIVERPGSCQWPDIDIQWWDPAEASLRNIAPALRRGWKSLTSVYHLPPLNPRD